MKAIAILMWLLFSTVDLREQTSNDTSTSLRDDSCLPWQVRNKTGICKCVIGDIQGIVRCRDEPYSLQLFQCFCMTYYTETNQSLVGSCQYTCDRHTNGHFFDITVNSSLKLNERMCSRYKRQGQLCGSCIAGFAPPVYSYSLSCVNCTTSNWAKYTAVSLLPVTAFFFIAITFRLSATSPKLTGYILCIQTIFTPSNMRLLESDVQNRFVFLYKQSTHFDIWYMEPGFSACCLHTILSSASHKHSSSLSSRLHHCCLSSLTHCTLLPPGPTI